MEEYWIVSPQGSVEIFYLEDGKYVLKEYYILQDDEEEMLLMSSMTKV